MLGELHEVLMLLPLLAIPAIGAGAGGAGAAAGGAGILTGITGALGSIPLIGGLFKKTGSSQDGSTANVLNMINANNTALVRNIKARYQQEQSKNYLIYAVLGLLVVVSLFYSLKKK